MMTILDNIILEKTKMMFLDTVGTMDIKKLKAKQEGEGEWDRRKEQANINNGRIGDLDFSYIFNLYEDEEDKEDNKSRADAPPAGQPPPPPMPPLPPPPGPVAGPHRTRESKLRKLHWNVLPLPQTKGDTIWSSSAKLDWDQVGQT